MRLLTPRVMMPACENVRSLIADDAGIVMTSMANAEETETALEEMSVLDSAQLLRRLLLLYQYKIELADRELCQ